MGVRRSCRGTLRRHMFSVRVAQGEELVGFRLGSGSLVSVLQAEGSRIGTDSTDYIQPVYYGWLSSASLERFTFMQSRWMEVSRG